MRYLTKGTAFSEPWAWEVYLRWQAWKSGIPPGPARDYGSQNPFLLDAFALLEHLHQQYAVALRNAGR